MRDAGQSAEPGIFSFGADVRGTVFLFFVVGGVWGGDPEQIAASQLKSGSN